MSVLTQFGVRLRQWLRRRRPLAVEQPSQSKAHLGYALWPETLSWPEMWLFYPSCSQPQAQRQHGVDFEGALDAPVAGLSRAVVVLSHGSGGSPFHLLDVITALVSEGIVVVAPMHDGDCFGDASAAGPRAWKKRPRELSLSLNRLEKSSWAEHLNLKQVGVLGVSAGGLSALVLCGARWSLNQLASHCLDHGQADSGFCFYGGDSPWRRQQYQWLKLMPGSGRLYSGHDRRIAAAVVLVPLVAVIEPQSLAAIELPVGTVEASLDQLLKPEFHVRQLRGAAFIPLAQLSQGGHFSVLSPWTEAMATQAGRVLLTPTHDPAGFDRSQLAEVNARISQFFVQKLEGRTEKPAPPDSGQK